MRRKILSSLAMAAAAVVVMAVPVVAQAAKAQAGGSALSVGSKLALQSTNFEIQTSTGNIACKHMEVSGEVIETGGSTVRGRMNSVTFGGCTGPLGSTMDISTNVSEQHAMSLEIQQPDANGQITEHFPSFGAGFQLTAQAQTFIGDVGTCDFSTIGNGIQLMGVEGWNVSVAEGAFQLEKQSGPSSLCSTGTVEGSFLLTSGGNAVTIDMT